MWGCAKRPVGPPRVFCSGCGGVALLAFIPLDGAIKLVAQGWPPDLDELWAIIAGVVLTAVGLCWLVDMLRGEGYHD